MGARASNDGRVWSMKKYRVIIAGGRHFTNYALLQSKCDALLKNLLQDEIEIVSGKAPGADSLGETYAEERGYSVAEFPADWNEHGKAGGHIRNAQMRDYSNYLIAFWDGKSRGTKNMIDIAKKAGLNVRVVRY